MVLVNEHPENKNEQWFLPHCHLNKETYVKENWKNTYSIVISSISQKAPVRHYWHELDPQTNDQLDRNRKDQTLRSLQMNMKNSVADMGKFIFYYQFRLTCSRRNVVGVIREGYQRGRNGPVQGNNSALILPPLRSKVYTGRGLNTNRNAREKAGWRYRTFIFG